MPYPAEQAILARVMGPAAERGLFGWVRPIAVRILLGLLAAVLTLTATSGTALAARVAVLMSAKVSDYDEALRGFRETTPHQIVAVYDMAGDLDRGRKQLAEIETTVKPDLIFAVGIWALQVVVGRPSTIPVVYAMVLNPPSVIGTDTKNVTGASMNVPVEQPIKLFKQLGPQVKRIGVIYNPARTGYLVRRGQRIARDEGLELVAREISSVKEAIGALDSFQERIDALWIVPDETTLSNAVVQQMLLYSYRRRIPLLGVSDRPRYWPQPRYCSRAARSTAWPRHRNNAPVTTQHAELGRASYVLIMC